MRGLTEASEAVRAVQVLSGMEPEAPRESGESGEPGKAAASGRAKTLETRENRLPFVRDAGKDFPEIRLDSVRETEPGAGWKDERRLEIGEDFGTDLPKVRLPSVRNGPPTPPTDRHGRAAPAQKHGQASRESPPGGFLAKAQNLPEELQKKLQDIEIPRPDTSVAHEKERPVGSAGRTPWRTAGLEAWEAADGSGPEIRRATHEIESEFQPSPEERPHETESEFLGAAHECESEFWPQPGEKLHETESEFLGAAHEGKSEFRETAGDAPRRPGGEWAGPGEDVETLAWALLEGLRRAAGARYGHIV